MNSEKYWSEFKKQWIEDAMRWGNMNKIEALDYWDKQEYRGK